ncbi:hypothetical protein EfmGK941_04780 [Enterococcus faecium]|nr:hypothetical protein EfmGK941_04780 [Enterococcus faecium]
MEEKNRLNAKQCSDQELKKIKGGAGTKPQGKPASNLVEFLQKVYLKLEKQKYELDPGPLINRLVNRYKSLSIKNVRGKLFLFSLIL